MERKEDKPKSKPLTLTFTLPMKIVLKIKKDVVCEMLEQFNKENDTSKGTANHLSWQVLDNSIYILKGKDIIGVV